MRGCSPRDHGLGLESTQHLVFVLRVKVLVLVLIHTVSVLNIIRDQPFIWPFTCFVWWWLSRHQWTSSEEVTLLTLSSWAFSASPLHQSYGFTLQLFILHKKHSSGHCTRILSWHLRRQMPLSRPSLRQWPVQAPSSVCELNVLCSSILCPTGENLHPWRHLHVSHRARMSDDLLSDLVFAKCNAFLRTIDIIEQG